MTIRMLQFSSGHGGPASRAMIDSSSAHQTGGRVLVRTRPNYGVQRSIRDDESRDGTEMMAQLTSCCKSASASLLMGLPFLLTYIFSCVAT